MTLVFDLWGDQAMFRKPYTTTSMVSFPFPPPTAISGLLGAIIGLDHGSTCDALRADYWQYFSGTQVALALKRPVEWFSTAVNLIKFKTANGDMSEHIQVKHQFLKRPAYRIYVRGGRIYPELKRRLEAGEFVYTPFLGVAYALAELNYLGEFDEQVVDEGSTFIDSLLPYYDGVQLDISQSGCLHAEVVPFRLDESRRQLETVNVIYPELQRGDKIWVHALGAVEISQVGRERVAWFASW